MKYAMERQRGIGIISLFFYLAAAIFVATVIMKLGPHYMEYLTVRSVMKDVAEDPTLAKASKLEIKQSLSNRLFINAVKSVNQKSFKFKQVDAGYLISVDYQAQEHLLANLDVLMNFKNEVLVAKK